MLTARTMIALSAVAATGIVFLTQPSHSEQTVGVESAKLQDRHPAFDVGAELRNALSVERDGIRHPAPASTPKEDRLNIIVKDCASYTWPRIPTACLTIPSNETKADDSTPTAPRTVSIEYGSAKSISFVTSTTTIVAQR